MFEGMHIYDNFACYLHADFIQSTTKKRATQTPVIGFLKTLIRQYVILIPAGMSCFIL